MSIYNLNGIPIYYEHYGNNARSGNNEHYGNNDHYGSGPSLVFLHGYTCTLEDWRSVADALADRYEVLLFDFRCHGQSAKTGEEITLESLTEDTHTLLCGLGIESPVIIGHSMGGMIAMEYGLRYPQEARALVLAEGHTHMDTTARIIGSAVLDERTPQAVTVAIETEMGAGAPFVSKSLFDSLLAYDVRMRVAELKVPILFLWADRYGDLTADKLPEILSEFGFQDMPNLQAQYILQSHHFLNLEQPQQTLQAIETFLKTV